MTAGIPKRQIRSIGSIEQHEHEDRADARRVLLVDQDGEFIDAGNPLPIAFDGTITVGNVTIQDDDGDELAINPDGSINVTLTPAQGGPSLVVNTPNQISSVPTSSLTNLVSYTVPIGKTAALQEVHISGGNIAKYDVFVNATRVDTKRTYFSGPLNELFDFRSDPFNGIPLVANDIVLVTVIHERPYVADFEGRIQVVEFG